jgi:hypothetical protein
MKRGPKPRAGVGATVVLVVRVTADERHDLEQVARETHRASIADVIREAVNEYVADYRESQVFQL